MQIATSDVTAARSALLPPRSIKDLTDCLEAVNRLGLIWAFTPGNGLFPALFTALDTGVEGQKWDWVWGWKDQIAASRQAYYGKVAGGRPTLVSLQMAPLLYAITGNTGDLEDDLSHISESLRLSDYAPRLLRYLEQNGPTGTRTLQAQLTDGSRPALRALEKALDQLDSGMLIAKSGIEGKSSYANLWDLFGRYLPEAVEAGLEIPTREAALRLMRHYFAVTPAIAQRQAALLFPWNRDHQEKAIARLMEAGEIITCLVDGKPGYCRTGWTPSE